MTGTSFVFFSFQSTILVCITLAFGFNYIILITLRKQKPLLHFSLSLNLGQFYISLDEFPVSVKTNEPLTLFFLLI